MNLLSVIVEKLILSSLLSSVSMRLLNAFLCILCEIFCACLSGASVRQMSVYDCGIPSPARSSSDGSCVFICSRQKVTDLDKMSWLYPVQLDMPGICCVK